MLILLSPAKDLNTEAPPTTKGATQPLLLEHSPALVEKLRPLVVLGDRKPASRPKPASKPATPR